VQASIERCIGKIDQDINKNRRLPATAPPRHGAFHSTVE